MRIAFITTEYVTEPKFDGGLANYLQRVAQGMRQPGHQVEIFTASDRDEDLIHEDIPVHRVNSQPPSKLLGLRHLVTLGRLGSTIYRLVVAHRLRRRFMRRTTVDKPAPAGGNPDPVSRPIFCEHQRRRRLGCDQFL